jgi:tripartite-type tricarboxylate transporter receptor subunit TctC
MRVSRRKLLQLGAAALAAVPEISTAETYPSRTIRLFVGFPAGNSPDIIGRIVGEGMSERLGQQLVVENRPGAGSNIAAELALRALPDGYTLLLATAANTINATLYPNLNFDFVRDIAPIGPVGRSRFVMVVNPELPAETVPEFITYVKANPGKVNLASPGVGSSPHIFGELFNMMAGIKLVHIPYRGSILADLLSGQVQVFFSSVPSTIAYIRAGNLRALGVTSEKRLKQLPDVPAIAEFLPGYEASGWDGIVAPKSTPSEIVEKLSNEIGTVVADPDIRKHLEDLEVEPMSMTAGEFGAFIAAEAEKWAEVVKAANIKLE